MEQEQKEKLLKYLCMALPYGVKAKNSGGKLCKVTAIAIHNLMSGNIKDIKPYLRPMSSMTEEEWRADEQLTRDLHYKPRPSTAQRLIDWYLEHHLDFMGLIDEGLAIAVTDEFNPYKD